MKLALFDMDGTLFWGDSQLRFARWVLSRYGLRRLYLLALLPAGILRALHLFNTPLMKRAMLTYAWGMKRTQLEAECCAFCEQELMPAMYPEVLACLRAHQAAGDTTVLSSASPHWWTQFVGETLGFTHVMGTPLPWNSQQRVRLMPPIDAPGNNKGMNKVLRLRAMGIESADVGYTDSAADLPMLSICSQAVLVNPKASLVARMQKEGKAHEILRPEHPKGHLRFALACLFGRSSS